jgi:AgrD protein
MLYCNKTKEDIIMNNFIAKFGGLVAALAIMVTAVSANRVCMFIMHQPELPKGAEKLRKF